MIELEPNNPQAYYTASAYGEDLAAGLKEFNRMEESAAAIEPEFPVGRESNRAYNSAAPFSTRWPGFARHSLNAESRPAAQNGKR